MSPSRASVRLDAGRLGRDAGRIAEEVVQHLAALVGSDVDVTLEIRADVPKAPQTTSYAPSPKTAAPSSSKTSGLRRSEVG